MKTPSGFFTFAFFDEETGNCTIYQFSISGERSVFENYFRNYDKYDLAVAEFEREIGIHDGAPNVGDLEGYVTTEIGVDQHQECMQHWHTWFGQQGFTIGEITQLPIDEDGNIPMVSEEEENERTKFCKEIDLIREEIFYRT
jgi:hypothetical protein